MPVRRLGYGPWYRGGVSRSYVPATIFVSVGYAICLVFFSVFFILAGGIMTGVSRISDVSSNPKFNDPFFKDHFDSSPSKVIKIIGPVLLGIGFTLLIIAIILCVVVGCMAKKQEDKRHKRQEQTEQPLTTGIPLQPPPPSAYPHQQATQNVYPAAGSYPYSPPSDQYLPGSYPPQLQNQYPSQSPAGFYPPPSSYMPPSGSPYPPPSYSQQTPNVAPENSQYISSGTEPSSEPTKQAY